MIANVCIRGRRSIHKFKRTPITHDANIIIETASFASIYIDVASESFCLADLISYK